MKYLLYPAADDQSISFYKRQSVLMQENIISSSSLAPDTERLSIYKNYSYLPNVFDENFIEKATALVRQRDISAIFCGDDFIAQELMRIMPGMPVIKIGDGFISLINRYMDLEKDAKSFIMQFEKKYSRGLSINFSQIAEILYGISFLLGQSYTSKVFHFIN